MKKTIIPPISKEAEAYFQQARTLEKANGWEDWSQIISLYENAIALGNWKAMYNLAGIYRIDHLGVNDTVPVKKDLPKADNPDVRPK